MTLHPCRARYARAGRVRPRARRSAESVHELFALRVEPFPASLEACRAAHLVPHADEVRIPGLDPALHELATARDRHRQDLEQFGASAPVESVLVRDEPEAYAAGRPVPSRGEPRWCRRRSGRTCAPSGRGRRSAGRARRSRNRAVRRHCRRGTRRSRGTRRCDTSRRRSSSRQPDPASPCSTSIADGSKPRDAVWKRRSNRAIDASAVPCWAQSGYGGTGTSPGTNTSRSRPASMPRGRDAPSKPAAASADRKPWIAVECTFAGRCTSSPDRTTRPTFATPPANTSSGSSSIAR